MSTTLDHYRRALLATAAELDQDPEARRNAEAAREAAAGDDGARMRWVLQNPYRAAPRRRTSAH